MAGQGAWPSPDRSSAPLRAQAWGTDLTVSTTIPAGAAAAFVLRHQAETSPAAWKASF